MNLNTARFAALMGSASFLSLITGLAAHAEMAPAETAPTLLTVAQAQVAQPAPAQLAQAEMAQAAPETVPEQVLITGSLIHGTAAVGVPVTNLGVQDFTQTGNTTIGDLFRTVPEATVAPGPSAVLSGGHQERETRVNIRGLDQTGPRTLLMVDGIRFPAQADGLCAIDPSIIPSLALDRVDILADGASATYGSDAIAGVINVVLKRSFDGATTLLHTQTFTDGGGLQFQASQLWGRTWEGGDVTLTYEWINSDKVKGTVHSNFTGNYTPWGLDNEIPIGVSMPGTISVGKPNVNNGAGVSGRGTICPNCYAVPNGTGANFNASLNNGLGPLLPGQAPVLSWSSLTAGTTNEVDPQHQGWEDGAEQSNRIVGTFDQRLFPGVSLFFTGFYSNRRVEELLPAEYSNAIPNEVQTYAVPTTNPYYPAGAPNNLQVSYDLTREIPPTIPAYELSMRYSFGFNLDLPFGWTGQIYDSRSYETNQYTVTTVNTNSAKVALGNTVSGVTKPASIPYLNLFCDPVAFHCNAPSTLAYITATHFLGDHYSIEEKGGRFDGPLFDLPAGQIKAAVGGDYESDNVVAYTANNGGELPVPGSTTAPPLTPLYDSEPYTVWAAFTQVDIPVFGDNFNIPLVRKLDIEGSWRHDQYNSPNGALKGGTSNPKLAFTWLVDELAGVTIRGSWGTSFRFANAGEYSTIASDANGAYNFPSFTTLAIPCLGGKANAGSIAADLVAAGFACGSTPSGIDWGGGPHPELRGYTTPSGQAATREGGTALAPETAINYSIGAEFAPQFSLLRGLDVQATYYSVKVNGTILGFLQLSSATFDNPAERFHFILPSDVGCPVAANAAPTTCAPFEKMAAAALLDRNSSIDISQQSNVAWLDDGSSVNSGFQHVSGVDFNASYDFDAGDFGAWNTGITGTYYLHRFYATEGGVAPVDVFHDCNEQPAGGISQGCPAVGTTGNAGAPRLVYRARLGWSAGPYSVTGFMNFQSHYFTGWTVPPNVNFQCTTAGGSVGGGTLPCAISNWSNIEPDFITFDLSLGYNTGDLPANQYLKNLTIQLVIQDLLDKHSPFEYGPSFSGRQWAAYDVNRPNFGRTVGLTLVKNW